MLALLAVAAVVAVVLGFWAAGSRDPAGLVSAQPADGARLATAPESVTLTFTGRVDPVRSHLAVIGPAGQPAAVAELRVDGNTLEQPVEIDGEGQVLVAYHAVLRDGREVSGQQTFLIGDGPAGPPPAAPELPTGDGHGHRELGPLAAVAILLMLAGGVAALVAALRPRRLH